MDANVKTGAMKQGSRFWDKIAARYSRQPIKDTDSYERKLALTRQYLEPTAQVLEFGCGTGGTALLHAPHVAHVLATDYSGAMIDIAKQRQTDEGIENVTFRQATIFEIERPADGFDAVLGLNVLHLVPEYGRQIERAFELLKPGGVFVTSTACLGTRSPLRLLLALPAALGFIPKVVFINRDSLASDMIAAGFETRERVEFGDTLFLIMQKP